MRHIFRARFVNSFIAAVLCVLIIACENIEGNIALGVVGATALGARTPSNEIEQTYYLGVFDPQEQLPPQLYRVRVHGQASAISSTKFASGWVPAALVDSLGSSVQPGKAGTTGENNGLASQIKTGRRLVMFGPEGFREAPADHRLVVVMGSNPQAFFNSIDTTLGDIAAVRGAQRADALGSELLQAMLELRTEQAAIAEIGADTKIIKAKVEDN